MRRSAEENKILDRYEKQPFTKIIPFFFRYRYLLVLSSFVCILFNLVGLVLPWMLKVAIDRVLPNADYVLFWVLCGLMLLIYLARSLLRYMASYMVDYIGIRFLVDVRQKVFRHLQSLSLRFYQEYRTGKLISNVISDAELMNGLLRTLSQMIEQTIQLCAIALLLFFLNWQMALFIVLTLPIHALNFRFFRRIIKKDYLLVSEQKSEVSANLSESLSGVKVVKSFAREHSEALRFFKKLRPIVGLQMRTTVDSIYLATSNEILTVITHLAIIGLGIRYVQNGDITIGVFVAFYSYVGMIMSPLTVLSNLSLFFAQGQVGASRIVNLLNTIPEIKEAEHPVHRDRFTGHIEFENVFFSYSKDENVPAIHDFSLSIRPGEKVALVGPSGSGKSTITNLLLRFYDVTRGAVLLDGLDVRRLDLEAYRRRVGVVLQEPFLFSGSIRDNIVYARPDCSEEEMLEAARKANADEFIQNLPEGYETIIGERGESLSGGQKQRLAIARAVLRDPDILILDEATSALDTLSEALVQDALDRLMENKTTIIIAHRLSTIQNADKIVVLDGGRIVQEGRHEELMARPGMYRDLYEKQKKMAEGRKHR